MAYSFLTYTGDGSTTSYGWTKPFIDRTHVKVYVDDVDTSFSWVTDILITISPAPADGAAIVIRRETPRPALTDFEPGGAFSEADLDRLAQQALYVADEAVEYGAASPIADAEAASTAAAASETAAAASAAAAAASEAAAGISETSAAADAAATAADAIATAADAAATAADAISTAADAASATSSAGAASTSETNAAASAIAAAADAVSTAADAAATAADAISTAADAAAASASAGAASTSETNAAASAAAAAADAIATAADAAATALDVISTAADAAAASASAGAAATSETNAGTAQTAAEAAKTAAETAQTGAETAETGAGVARTAAEAAQAATETVYDNFDDRYLGAKASDPTVDNDGNPLVTGALYFNTTDGDMKVWNGSAWQVTYNPGGGGGVDSFNTRTGAVVPLQTDYDSFFLTPTEGDAAYSQLGHGHAISDVTGLQTALDAKAAETTTISAGTGLSGGGDLSANRSLAIDKATTAEVYGFTADQVLTADNVGDGADFVVMAYAATLSLDWKAGLNRLTFMTGNATLGNPSNVVPGTCIVLRIIQDGTGGRTLGYASYYEADGDGGLPVLSTAASATDYIGLFAVGATSIVVFPIAMASA